VSASDGIVPNRLSLKDLVVWMLIVAQLFTALLLLATRKDDEAASVAVNEATTDQKLKQGFALHALGRTEDAEKAYTEVLAKDPENKLAHYNLGVIADKNGDGDEAENRYKRALSSDPDFVPALFNLAIRREAAGAPKEAEELYRKIILLDAGMAKAHLNLGFLLLRKLDRKDEGKTEILKAVELDSSLASRVSSEELAGQSGR
jgi:tetratricopeptide (TPR) repeat protein